MFFWEFFLHVCLSYKCMLCLSRSEEVNMPYVLVLELHVVASFYKCAGNLILSSGRAATSLN